MDTIGTSAVCAALMQYTDHTSRHDSGRLSATASVSSTAQIFSRDSSEQTGNVQIWAGTLRY